VALDLLIFLKNQLNTVCQEYGIFKYEFVANLSMSLSAEEFQKSVNIWGSYGQEFSVLFPFDSQCIGKM